MKKSAMCRLIAEHYYEENVFSKNDLECFPLHQKSNECDKSKFEQEERKRGRLN